MRLPVSVQTLLLLAPAFFLSIAIAQQQPQTTSTPDAPAQPALTSAQQLPLDPKLPTLFIVGDSTARNKEDLGWGDHLAHLFNLDRINVANRARAGRSSRTFINEGAWDAVLKEMKPGDFVLLQMGHNDGGDLGGAKPRGTLKGVGDETQVVPQTSGPLTGQSETVHTYGWYIRKYIADTRAHGATPMLLTLTVRNVWTGDHIERDMKSGDSTYDTEIREIGAQQHVPVIDMATPAADEFEHLGEAETARLFPIDHTHTSPKGAELNAAAVVSALRSAHAPV